MITTRCTECGAESSGSGGIVHAKTCSAVTLAPKSGYGQMLPATELKFDSEAERKRFMANLSKAQGTHNYGVTPEHLQNLGNMPQATRSVVSYSFDNLEFLLIPHVSNPKKRDALKSKLEAYIQAETTKARGEAWDDCALHIAMQHHMLSAKEFKEIMDNTRAELGSRKGTHAKSNIQTKTL